MARYLTSKRIFLIAPVIAITALVVALFDRHASVSSLAPFDQAEVREIEQIIADNSPAFGRQAKSDVTLDAHSLNLLANFTLQQVQSLAGSAIHFSIQNGSADAQ